MLDSPKVVSPCLDSIPFIKIIGSLVTRVCQAQCLEKCWCERALLRTPQVFVILSIAVVKCLVREERFILVPGF